MSKQSSEIYLFSGESATELSNLLQDEIIPGKRNKIRFASKLVSSVVFNHLKETFYEFPKAIIENMDSETKTIDMRQWEQDRRERIENVTTKIGNWAVEKRIFSYQASVNWLSQRPG
jgi:hypothetical protein